MPNNATQKKASTKISEIPQGFTTGTGPDGKDYLVPQYLVPSLNHAFASYRTKSEVGVQNAQPGVSQYFTPSMCAIWGTEVSAP
jgi:hypothetical protein